MLVTFIIICKNYKIFLIPINQCLTNCLNHTFLEHAERKITDFTFDEAFELFSAFKNIIGCLAQGKFRDFTKLTFIFTFYLIEHNLLK